MTATDDTQVMLEGAQLIAAAERAKQPAMTRFTELTGGFDMKEDARQDSLDQLWELFHTIKEEAATEAEKDEVDLNRLSTLVRVSSQAADNYRYHAGH